MKRDGEADAKTIYTGGTVLPLDGKTEPQEALITENGRIAALGSEEDMRALAGSGARQIDLQGATVMPGLIDTHPHYLHWSTMKAPVDLLDAVDHDDIVRRIRAAAEQTPAGEWIVCTPVGEPYYYLRRSFRDLREGQLPDRHVLDRAAPNHPVWITADAPQTPNVTAFNTEALKRLGISSITPERVCDVLIDKDPFDDRPTGLLRGPVNLFYTHDPFWLQVRSKLPVWTEQDWYDGVPGAMKIAHGQGVTAAYECHAMDPVHIEAYQRAHDEDRLAMRVMCVLESVPWALDVHADPSPEEIVERLELAKSLTQLSGEYMRVNGITMNPGGVSWTGELATDEPYLDPCGRLTHGRTYVRPEIQSLIVEWCLEHELRLNLCQIGPRDHAGFFKAVAPFLDRYDVRSRGWVAQHAIFLNEAEARRYAELGFDMTACMGFTWGKGDMVGKRIGKHIWDDLGALKRIVDLGINLSCSTDWGPGNVFEQMWLAETHEFCGSGHRNLLPGHALNREESLLTWTRNGAQLMRWEGLGSIAPDYHADLAILDRNPLTCDLDDLPSAQVLRTVVGGDTVHDNGSL